MTVKQIGSAVLLAVACATSADAGVRTVWAIGDGDKVKRDAQGSGLTAPNAVWHDGGVHVFAARNEIVAFQVMVQADARGLSRLTARLPALTAAGGESIVYRAPPADPTDFVDRPIQLFVEHYMRVEKPSNASWIFEPGSPAAPVDQLGWVPVQLVPEQ